MPDRKECGSCKAPVMFVQSAATGNYMCLNADPVENGNIVILDDKAHVRRGDMFEQMIPEGTPHYTDHHSNCPAAAKYRKGKGKK